MWARIHSSGFFQVREIVACTLYLTRPSSMLSSLRLQASATYLSLRIFSEESNVIRCLFDRVPPAASETAAQPSYRTSITSPSRCCKLDRGRCE